MYDINVYSFVHPVLGLSVTALILYAMTLPCIASLYAPLMC